MSQWYEHVGDFSEEQERDKHVAYYQTFMSSSHGRAVLLDVIRLLKGRCGKVATMQPHHALAQVAMNEIADDLLKVCGVDLDMNMMAAMATLAERYEPKPREAESGYSPYDPVETG